VSLALLPVLLAARIAVAQATPDPAAAFDAANRLYEEGRYREAIQAYQAIGSNAPFAALHFNLGNAFYKAGQPGQAIAAFRHARALAPRDRDVRTNLRFVRSGVSGPTWRPGLMERLVQRFTSREWALVASALLWMSLGLLAVAQFKPSWRVALRNTIVISALLALALLAVTLWSRYGLDARRFVAVVESETVVRLGPFEGSPAAMTVKDGAELLVVDQKDDWFQVTADGRASGWIPASAVRPIR
jgi:tetratricopeptide (TPR) repeat protein